MRPAPQSSCSVRGDSAAVGRGPGAAGALAVGEGRVAGRARRLGGRVAAVPVSVLRRERSALRMPGPRALQREQSTHCKTRLCQPCGEWERPGPGATHTPARPVLGESQWCSFSIRDSCPLGCGTCAQTSVILCIRKQSWGNRCSSACACACTPSPTVPAESAADIFRENAPGSGGIPQA